MKISEEEFKALLKDIVRLVDTLNKPPKRFIKASVEER